MKRRLLFVFAIAAPGLVLGAAPVVEQSTPAAQVVPVAASSGSSSSGSARTAPAAGDTVALRKQLADFTLEIEQLRTELREMRGQLETQTHELESLKNRNREALADMDKRLREQEKRSAPAAPAAAAPAT